MQAWTILKAVHWQRDGKTAHAWTALGSKHGFTGKQEPSPPGVHHARQVHSTRIATAAEATTSGEASRRIEADGILTLTPGTRIAIKTADCLPILLWVPGLAAAAVHAGWRGLTSGIIGEAVQAMTMTGIKPAQILAVIGPAISQEAFEVGSEVIDSLHHGACGLTPVQAALCTAKGKGDRWHLDLAVAGVLSLCNAELDPVQISVLQTCTYKTPEWHSYRRDGKGHGSNWSWLEL